ncbi:CRISPR-associated helicase Cas3' [Lactobacillus xylocopicola]|uniref:CRISPR-associated helicase/endonuclease Cas3 n=1 Tax=Lactobacillus xylocopicola TaxID=2976676 RepID=A0ABN6SJM9_9LACO|nr:CRISPR-associated helicase Cas3' [Lactobacillus xylocopicola]BDR60581.1 CRISPR-associated helicase/endonuclease Cas3 [Lactobacillus xylocopicola]
MDKEVKALWAKKRTDNGEQLWLPLLAHLIDTANVINWLLSHKVCEGTKKWLSENVGGETELRKLVKFLGFNHDIGKATPAFQTKSSYSGDDDLDEKLIENLIDSGFTKLNDYTGSSRKYSPHAKAGEALLEDLGLPDSIGAIIGGHHGDAGPVFPAEQLDDYPDNYRQYDTGNSATDAEAVRKNWQAIQKEIFEYGLKLAGYHSVAEIPAVNQAQAVILEGLLITADWFASSEFLGDDPNQKLFPLIPLDLTFDDLDLEGRFEAAVEAWDISGDWIPEKVDVTQDPYKKRWGFTARPVQRVITEAIEDTSDPGMIIIEAPMGLGKTETSLIATEQLAYATQRDGLFWGLPTQATSNAMFTRVNTWLGEIADEQNDHLAIKLLHGKAQFNQEYANLPNASNVEDAGAVVVNSWFTGKKSILSKFAVGTIDTLLLMALKQKHLFLRHLGFSDKVIVIDEVHAYDAYMNQYLYRAIEWLGAYRVPLVLLSATLPKDKRVQLLKSYYHGKYQKKLTTDAEWVESQAYPLLTILDGSEVKQVSHFAGQSDQKPVSLKVQRINLESDKLIKSILTAINDGGIAGIIVNTVKRSQELAKLVDDETVELIVLHSAFLAPERIKIEERLQTKIGKGAKRPHKMIVIGTQVLEQSLDIDFDVLYTDIAPMDLLLQRAGRLHRHLIERPPKFRAPKLSVMGIEAMGSYGAANEAVYEKYLLMKTDYYLNDEIHLPDDISNLVQKTYDENNDPEIAGLSAAKAEFAHDLERSEIKAKAFRIAAPINKKRKTLHGWLDRSHSAVDEQKAQAAVRDIKETLDVLLLQEKNHQIFLLDGRPIETCQSKELAGQVIRLPAAVSFDVNDIIDVLEETTGKYFPTWQSDKWLKGELAVVLDGNNNATIHLKHKKHNWLLNYSAKFGLKIIKEEVNE